MADVAERLSGYYNFDETTLATAERIAEWQQSLTWQDFLAACGLQEPERWTVESQATEIIEFRPLDDFDEKKARVFWAPVANSLDPNMAYQAATIFAFDPTSRLFAVANPSGPGRSAGTLSLWQRHRVARGDLTPLVEPTLRLLEEEGVERVVHIGGSLGAETSQVANRHAARFGQQVLHTVAIEPPAVKDRSVVELGQAFIRSGAHLSEYVEASGVPAFETAWHESGRWQDSLLKFLRPTNIATIRGLQHGVSARRAAVALTAESEMRVTIAWGSESELALDGLVQEIVDKLQDEFGADRVRGVRLEGQYHALTNDIHLQAALVHDALRH